MNRFFDHRLLYNLFSNFQNAPYVLRWNTYNYFFYNFFFSSTEYVASNSFDTQGPTFTLEPSFRLEFTNTAGSRADCTARGNPPPHVEWLDLDNNAVTTIQSVSSFLNLTFSNLFLLLKNVNCVYIHHVLRENLYLYKSKFKRKSETTRRKISHFYSKLNSKSIKVKV